MPEIVLTTLERKETADDTEMYFFLAAFVIIFYFLFVVLVTLSSVYFMTILVIEFFTSKNMTSDPTHIHFSTFIYILTAPYGITRTADF